MKLQKVTSLAFIAGTLLVLSLLFQNCSKIAISDIEASQAGSTASAAGDSISSTTPSIQITTSATTVVEGQQSLLTVRLHSIETATYKCIDKFTQQESASGLIIQSQQDLRITVNHDLKCEVVGFAKNSEEPIVATQNLTLDCANRIKNTDLNKCQDFKCGKVIELASMNDLLKIEARDARGLCYAIKLLSAIRNSSSTLTKEIDQEVTSRNHDGGSTNHHPYSMGSIKTEFRLEGERVVKISGGLSETAPILVDNFVLIGVHPADRDVSADLNSAYSALGTSDSTVISDLKADTNSIEFHNVLIPLKKYGSGGTSSLSPVDITRSAQPKIMHSLDFRALDCGGARELSDIYLLFQ